MATKTVSFRFPTDLVEAIEAEARATSRSKTQVVIAALAKFYDCPYALTESITLEQLQEQLNELTHQIAILSGRIPPEFSPTNSEQEFVTRWASRGKVNHRFPDPQPPFRKMIKAEM